MTDDAFRNAGTERLTENLLDQLIQSPTPDTAASQETQIERNLANYLNGLLTIKGRKRIDVIHVANLNETFGYQIFSGTRNPSRDKVLSLCFALHCSVKESQHLLWHADAACLYPKNRRDAIIIYCLAHDTGIAGADEQLFRFGEATIQDADA